MDDRETFSCEMGQRLTARFKWDYSRTARPEVFDALIAELHELSDLFRECWQESEILAHFAFAAPSPWRSPS